MNKIMMILATIAMTTFSVQANNAEAIDMVVAAIDATTEADTNGTKEETPKGN